MSNIIERIDEILPALIVKKGADDFRKAVKNKKKRRPKIRKSKKKKKGLLGKIDRFLDMLDEKRGFKRVVRKGKIIRKLICPPGSKAKDGKCIKMSPTERIKRSRSAKRAQKKMSAGKRAKMEKKKAKSLRRRASAIPDKATKTGGQVDV